jgi:hypothetical protein
MQKFFGFAVGAFLIIGFVSSVNAINITFAEVQNGVAVVKGNKAAKNATIIWENANVAKTNKGGAFSFSAAVPNDCIGTLSDGVSSIEVAVLDCTPVTAFVSPVPRTGQTTSYAAHDDGALQRGIGSPIPRFSDNDNGTVTDHLTGLIWLKDADCFGFQNWGNALSFANALAHGSCSLTDASVSGEWRLPNVKELESLIDFGQLFPALPAGHPFVNVQTDSYWSSTSDALSPTTLAWIVYLPAGGAVAIGKENLHSVWPVRGGQ